MARGLLHRMQSESESQCNSRWGGDRNKPLIVSFSKLDNTAKTDGS